VSVTIVRTVLAHKRKNLKSLLSRSPRVRAMTTLRWKTLVNSSERLLKEHQPKKASPTNLRGQMTSLAKLDPTTRSHLKTRTMRSSISSTASSSEWRTTTACSKPNQHPRNSLKGAAILMMKTTVAAILTESEILNWINLILKCRFFRLRTGGQPPLALMRSFTVQASASAMLTICCRRDRK
jgi:hypothetical protein